MPSTTLILLLLSPIFFFGIWHLTSSLIPPPPKTLVNNKRIILLIAHPDDESMFFSPTLQALTAPSLGNHLKVLCLSTGNSDGLGETRRKELEAAAVTLGLRRREDVFVLDDPRFKDGMKEEWNPNEIAKVLASAFAPQLNQTTSSTPAPAADLETPKSKSSKTKTKSKSSTKSQSTSTPPATPQPIPEGPRASIDVLITFDQQGISNHPNHIALYHGARQFLENIMKGHSGYACPVTLYTLPSVNIVRKYSFILDTIPTLIHGVIDSIINKQTGKKSSDDRVIFVNDFSRYGKTRRAMTDGHKSQMVWFRWGWISLSRYMVINDLKKEKSWWK